MKNTSNKPTKSVGTRLPEASSSTPALLEQTRLRLPNQGVPDLDGLELLDREDLIATIKRMVNGGVSLSFHGKRTAMEIARRVRPRITRRISDLHVGTPEEQSRNLLIEGENLQAMVTLYKYRGQVDLILVHVVERARSRLVADRCANRLPSNKTLQAELPHQPLHCTPRNIESFALHLPPDLPDAIDREVLGKDPHDLRPERFIALSPG